MQRINIDTRTDQELSRIDAMYGLPQRVRRFILSYIKLGVGRTSAIRAGYPESTAAVKASKLLANPKVKRAIRTCIALECERFDASEDSIIKALTTIVNASMGDYVTWDNFNRVKLVPKSDLTPEQLFAIDEITETNSGVKIKIKDKLKALESLSKIKGLFKEKKELEIVDKTPHLSCDYDVTKLDVEELKQLRTLLDRCRLAKDVRDVDMAEVPI